ncbi:MAG: PadR family transcriptional regulator [Anaerolineaceae bacterium]|nr:PadR family transcriptional regulator [Anaerolineaceae bacterium]
MSVRYAILGLLAQHPRHGYDLRAAFTAVIGGNQNWDVKPAQIYTTLNRLEEAGLVMKGATAQEGGPEKHIYNITDLGQLALTAWFSEGVTPEHQRDEFFVKLMTALASAMADPYQIIQKQRQHLFQDLHAATVLRNQYDPQSEIAQILLLEKSIMHLEADLRWLDMCEARLAEIQRQPIAEPEMRPRGRPKKSNR